MLQRFPQNVDENIHHPGLTQRTGGVRELQLNGLTMPAEVGVELHRAPPHQYLLHPGLPQHSQDQGVVQLGIALWQPEAEMMNVVERIERLDICSLRLVLVPRTGGG